MARLTSGRGGARGLPGPGRTFVFEGDFSFFGFEEEKNGMVVAATNHFQLTARQGSPKQGRVWGEERA
jgi:hypothetical protein